MSYLAPPPPTPGSAMVKRQTFGGREELAQQLMAQAKFFQSKGDTARAAEVLAEAKALRVRPRP